jgi:hypothetical protein
MEFDIQAADPFWLKKHESHTILIPPQLRAKLGILVGQFIQIRGRSELVLQVRGGPPTFEAALVTLENFQKIKGQNVSFKILDVTLGCDPEFFIVRSGAARRDELVSASTYLPFQGVIGCDGYLGELRPRYGRHEDQVVGTLRRLIPQIPSTLKRTSWAQTLPDTSHAFRYEAHSWRFERAAGFHVHLGIPPEILNTRKDFSRHVIRHMVRCLDWYVSVPLVPLEDNATRRQGQAHYGLPGDYRPSNLTLEYRTPGAFYLRTPELAAGLLGLCLMVTETVVSRLKVLSKNFVNLQKLSSTDLQEALPIPEADVIRGTLLAGSANPALKKMETIRNGIMELPSYSLHREAVDKFFTIVERGIRPGPDLLHNWKE